MALEISEIGISMRVLGENEAGGEGRNGGASPGNGHGDVDQEWIVSECVRRALSILKSAEER